MTNPSYDQVDAALKHTNTTLATVLATMEDANRTAVEVSKTLISARSAATRPPNDMDDRRASLGLQLLRRLADLMVQLANDLVACQDRLNDLLLPPWYSYGFPIAGFISELQGNNLQYWLEVHNRDYETKLLKAVDGVSTVRAQLHFLSRTLRKIHDA